MNSDRAPPPSVSIMFPWLGRAWRRNPYTSRGWAVGCKCFGFGPVLQAYDTDLASNVMRPMTRRRWEAGLKRAHPRRIATEGHVTSAAKAEIVSFSKHGSATDLCNSLFFVVSVDFECL